MVRQCRNRVSQNVMSLHLYTRMPSSRTTETGAVLKMTENSNKPMRILSGMRPTGKLHLGHMKGVLDNWLQLQHDHQCYLFAADWHALTTDYANPEIVKQTIWDMLIDWLAVGIDPEKAVVFIQSEVPEHAELHLLLSFMTPLSWLERVPTYKDQIEQLKEKDLGPTASLVTRFYRQRTS